MQGGSSSATTTVTIPRAGNYQLAFATRGRWAGNVNTYNVLVDNVVVATVTPESTSAYNTVTISLNDLAEGDHTISFRGLIAADVTSFIDAVTLTPQIAFVTNVSRVQIDGWRDKYVQLPVGAEADILRLVSQGEASSFQEDTGNTWLDTNVKLHQIGWYNPATGEKRQDSRAGSAWAGFTQGVANPGAGWQALYSLEYLNGIRSVELADGRTFTYSDTDMTLA